MALAPRDVFNGLLTRWGVKRHWRPEMRVETSLRIVHAGLQLL